MNFIDSHCHLYAEQFDEDRDLCVKRAKDLGVSKTVLPNIDLESIDGMMALAKKYPGQMFPAMGLHPCSVKDDFKEILDKMKPMFDTEKFVAVGEIGVDLYWDKTFLPQQKEAFKIQCQWAKELELPIIIHVRDSFNEVFELMDEVYDENLKGVFHCFSGNQQQAEKALSYDNFYLGLGGVLTFKNSKLGETIKHVDINRLMLETDAPYLTPAPYRGKRNEPSYTFHVGEKLAEVKEMPLSDVAAITTANAEKLFSI